MMYMIKETKLTHSFEKLTVDNFDNNQQEVIESVETFDELGLSKPLLQGIYGYGFEEPSGIQKKAILPFLKSKDIVAQSQSGSGKTGAFTIGSLGIIDPELDSTQIIVLSPTKDLSNQTHEVFSFLGEYLKLSIVSVMGGTDLKKSIQELRKGAQIVIGTPGRIVHMLDSKIISVADLKYLILDEADLLLNKGFLEEMKKIVNSIANTSNIALFSATMPKEIVELTDKFMTNPVKILLKDEDVKVKGISQYYVLLKKEHKLEVLLNLYRGLDIAQAIIFCNSKKNVDFVTEHMKSKGHSVSSIHTDLNQSERFKVMKEFRSGVTRVLVASDVLARGIDVHNISIVINYDLPFESEAYIHRIGRAGRFGRKGNSITFVVPDEMEILNGWRDKYDFKIEKLPTDLSQMK